jgi:hypothetical protein
MICCSVKRFFMFVFSPKTNFTRLQLALFAGGRSQWETMCGGFPAAASIHSCLWLALAKWSPLLEILQIWRELRDHFAWWELNNVDLYPEYRRLIEREHRDDARFDAMIYARNPFLFRPSDDRHSAALAMLLDMPSGRRKGI